MNKVFLTTFDNPFNPFTDYESWLAYDLTHENCCGYLGRIANTSDSMSIAENEIEVERAIDEIIKHDFMNVYRKVTKDSKFDTTMQDI